MPVRSNARRSAIARLAAGLSTPSANAAGRERFLFGGSSSGRTTDSDSVYLGSNPSPPAKNRGPPQGGPFHWAGTVRLRIAHIVTLVEDDAPGIRRLQAPDRGEGADEL